MSFVEIIGVIFLVLGIFFTAVAAIGLIRMPDVYNRLHASSKALTFGVLGILISTIGLGGPELSIRSIMTGIFILLTAPIATTVIARAAYRRQVPLAPQSILDEMPDRHLDSPSPGKE